MGTTVEEDMKAWEDQYLKGKSKKSFNPFKYVSIPIKEYKKLIRAEERIRMKVEAECNAKIAEIASDRDIYEKWYREKRDALEEAKAQIAEMLGLQELQKVKKEQEEE